ncbi:MAG TPA: flagellar biosynthetic protein FliO [Chloroflexota bacterium]|nr:flagellar biosynthetic protein FliO [Chloroflexota bacterium]
MKQLANNRLLWVVLGVVFVAMLGFGAVTSQMATSVPATAAASAAPASAAPSGAPQGSAAAKPFLAEYQDPQPQAAPSTVMTVVGLTVKLAVVIGLIYLTVLALRYFGNRGRKVFMGASSINVLEKTALSQNRELILVDVADKVLLLGATANNISVLTEITDPDAIDELRTKPQPSLPSAEPFLSYLKNVGEKVGTEVANVTPIRPADILKRIEGHKERVRERTAALQGGEA